MFNTLYMIITALINNVDIKSFSFTHKNGKYTYTTYRDRDGNVDIQLLYLIRSSEMWWDDFWWECGTYNAPDKDRIEDTINYHIKEIF